MESSFMSGGPKKPWMWIWIPWNWPLKWFWVLMCMMKLQPDPENTTEFFGRIPMSSPSSGMSSRTPFGKDGDSTPSCSLRLAIRGNNFWAEPHWDTIAFSWPRLPKSSMQINIIRKIWWHGCQLPIQILLVSTGSNLLTIDSGNFWNQQSSGGSSFSSFSSPEVAQTALSQGCSMTSSKPGHQNLPVLQGAKLANWIPVGHHSRKQPSGITQPKGPGTGFPDSVAVRVRVSEGPTGDLWPHTKRPNCWSGDFRCCDPKKEENTWINIIVYSIYYNIYLIMYICMQYACTSDSTGRVCAWVYMSTSPSHPSTCLLTHSLPCLGVWHLFSKTHGKEVKNPCFIKLTWSLCMQMHIHIWYDICIYMLINTWNTYRMYNLSFAPSP